MTLYLCSEPYDEGLVKRQSNYLFVFDDDKLGTMEKNIRHLPNTFGLITRYDQNGWIWSHFSDEDLVENMKLIRASINNIGQKLKKGRFKGLVFPRNGLGHCLKKTAPLTYQYLIKCLEKSCSGLEKKTL